MKKFLSLLMALCLLFPTFCLSEGESVEGDELLIEEIVEAANSGKEGINERKKLINVLTRKIKQKAEQALQEE